MEYSNFYDLKSLVRLNEREGCACSIEERDVEKVNRLIFRMRKEREENPAPVAGDTVTYTTRGGDYYPQAHIERSDGREAQLCLLPRMPFCHEKEGRTCYNTEGGPWVTTDPGLLLPDGIRGKQFRTWGHTGRHENGAVLFHTSVRAWKYTEPEPLYGEYTTKNGQNTSSNAGRTLSRQARSFTGTNHSLSTPRKNWTGWSGSCTEDFSTDSAKACSYYGDTGWNGRNSPHGNGTC